MREINRDNYELFVLDYIEGRLPMDMLIKFEAFLSNNKDIAAELEDLPDFSDDVITPLSAEDQLALKKGSLLSKEIDFENCDYYFAAYHAGDLNPKEKEAVEAFVQAHPDLKDDFAQVALIRFNTDKSIVFPLKKNLKKVIPLRPFAVLLRVAAVLILLIAIGSFLFIPSKKSQQYSERKEDIHFPQEKEIPITFVAIEEDNIQVEPLASQKLNSTKVEELSIAAEDKIALKEQLAIAPPEKELPNNEDMVIQEDELAAAEEPKEKVDLALFPEKIAIAPAVNEDEASESIIKFKRPFFKKEKEENELLASSDEEVILRISNPLKNKNKNGFTIGPITVKKN